MPLEVKFTLDDQDLDYFRDIMSKAQNAAESLSEPEVVKRAQAMLDNVRNDAKAPQFVLHRLESLQSLINMLDDEDWPLAESEHQDVISALAYFYDPMDLIDDSLPVLGLLDDAIMIELVLSEMQNEVSAYEEFCRFRSSQESLSGKNISRDDWLNSKRREILDQMRERMARRHRGTSGGRFTRFSFFG